MLKGTGSGLVQCAILNNAVDTLYSGKLMDIATVFMITQTGYECVQTAMQKNLRWFSKSCYGLGSSSSVSRKNCLRDMYSSLGGD